MFTHVNKVKELNSGEQFTVRITKTTKWNTLFSVLYHTALGRPVRVKLRSGQELEGTFVEMPSYFHPRPKAYLEIPGRVYRKGIPTDEIVRWSGVRAPKNQTKLVA